MEQQSLLPLSDPEERPLHRATPERQFERQTRKHAKKILKSMIIAACAGDTTAARMLLDRIWPIPRSPKIDLILKPTRTTADVRNAMHDVLAQIASGRISSADGQAIIAIMKDIVVTHTAADILPFAPESEVENPLNARQQLASRLLKAIASRNGNAATGSPDGDSMTAQDSSNAVIDIEATPQSPQTQRNTDQQTDS